MRRPQFFFFRGSTPTLELSLPFAPEAEDAACLTLAQDGTTVLEYALGGGTSAQGSMVPAEDDPSVLLVHMTQADTLRLRAGDCELQLRVRTAEGADTFFPIFGQIGEARKQGVI
jgi:hypothetical protein